MKRYCQIKDGICWWIFESETPPEFAPDIIIKDISAEKYQAVQEGWTWDEKTDMFYAPKQPIVPEPTTQPDLQSMTQESLMEQQYQTSLLEMILNK